MIRSSTTRVVSSIPNNVSKACSRRMASVTVPPAKDPVQLDHITTLSNGIRVATEALPGHFSGIGVYIDAGSRYENESLSGVSHIIDRLAFKSTRSRPGDKMLESIEMLGGNIHCASSRESLMYQSASFNSAVPDTMAILAETIRDPLITTQEIHQQLETAEYEISEIWAKPELILPEMVHVAAYQNNTLGNPLLCPQERLHSINRQVIDNYRKTFYRPERMVVAFAGVDHNRGVKLAEKWFGDMSKGSGATLPDLDMNEATSSNLGTGTYPSNSSSTTGGIMSKLPFVKNLSTSASHHASISATIPFQSPNLSRPATYTGGYLSLPTAPIMIPGMFPLTHIHLAFEAPSITSDSIYAVAVLQTLLGGGGSFSAGGPGKGMYSRLYTNVLNQHGWVENCVAFNHGYSDSGLFGISSACQPHRVTAMLDVMCSELKKLYSSRYGGLTQVEVDRAKNQLRSNLLMNLESRMVELEDLGRQVQTHGRKIGPQEMCAKIDAVSINELKAVAQEMFEGKVKNIGQGTGAPTVVVQHQGDVTEATTHFQGGWQEVQERISKWKLGRL